MTGEINDAATEGISTGILYDTKYLYVKWEKESYWKSKISYCIIKI